VIREFAKRIPAEEREDPTVRELASYGCQTTMHLVRLLAPRLDNEDHMKDIDFSVRSIEARQRAGYDAARRIIAKQSWRSEVDPLTGVVIHEAPADSLDRVRKQLSCIETTFLRDFREASYTA
jgi:NTE family protein